MSAMPATQRTRIAGFGLLAAFLNAAFDFCLGCELYLLLRKSGLVRA